MDIVIRNIDDAITERLDQIANDLDWTIDEVTLHALRYGLGLGGQSLVSRERRDIARLRGVWNSDETAMFDDALTAFEHIDGRPLFTENEDPPAKAPSHHRGGPRHKRG
ncbi:MAG: hypothetical protein ABIW82_00625 [Dokdonella sp.]